MEKRSFETAAIVEMHLVTSHSDGSYFAVAAFVLMRGGAPSPPRIRFAREVGTHKYHQVSHGLEGVSNPVEDKVEDIGEISCDVRNTLMEGKEL